jgi:hypothetical protein
VTTPRALPEPIWGDRIDIFRFEAHVDLPDDLSDSDKIDILDIEFEMARAYQEHFRKPSMDETLAKGKFLVLKKERKLLELRERAKKSAAVKARSQVGTDEQRQASVQENDEMDAVADDYDHVHQHVPSHDSVSKFGPASSQTRSDLEMSYQARNE